LTSSMGMPRLVRAMWTLPLSSLTTSDAAATWANPDTARRAATHHGALIFHLIAQVGLPLFRWVFQQSPDTMTTVLHRS
jgi:hypothetical protein